LTWGPIYVCLAASIWSHFTDLVLICPAYSSLLRILHRHFPTPMSSSFVSALPAFSTPSPASTPTPTPTPFPSPVSPWPTKSTPAQSAWSSPSDDESQEVSYVNRRTGEETNPSSISFRRSLPHVEIPQHPPAHAVLSEHTELSLHKTFGALAYPEWRTELVKRAQRAGMGDVGGALRWVLWQSDLELARDLEAMQNQKNGDGVAEKPRKRRGTVGSRSSRKYRRSTAATAASSSDAHAVSTTSSDSEASETGKLTVGSDSEESSEAEWHGWMADLFRQQNVQAQAKRAQEDAEVTAALQRRAFQEGDLVEELPRTPAEDRRLLLEKRKALEPVGIVTTMSLIVPSSTSGTVFCCLRSLFYTCLYSSCFYAFHYSLLPFILGISCSSSASTCSQFLATSFLWSPVVAWAFVVQIHLAPGYPRSSKTRWTQPLPFFIHVHRTALNFSDDGTLVAKTQHADPNDRSTLLPGITSGPTYASAQHATINI
jgi:hypothetical protein